MKRWWAMGFVLWFTFAAHAGALAGVDDTGVAGHWAGGIDLPAGELSIAVDLEAGEDGAWGGKIDIPQQGIRALPLLDVRVEGSVVSFRLPEIPGDPTLEGTLAEDGSSISGELIQSGQSFPFSIERAKANEADPYAEYETAGRPGEGLVGTWRGLIVAGPSRLRVVLAVKDAGDGALAATFASPDQGGLELPLDSIALDQKTVSFAIARVGAGYTGVLSEDGSEIAGTWTQNVQSAQLDLRRATPD